MARAAIVGAHFEHGRELGLGLRLELLLQAPGRKLEALVGVVQRAEPGLVVVQLLHRPEGPFDLAAIEEHDADLGLDHVAVGVPAYLALEHLPVGTQEYRRRAIGDGLGHRVGGRSGGRVRRRSGHGRAVGGRVLGRRDAERRGTKEAQGGEPGGGGHGIFFVGG